MGERTSYGHGDFSWVDLTTPDVDGAALFYGELLGWSFEDQPTGGGSDYRMAYLEGHRVAAMAQDDPSPAPPHWNSYVTVEAVDDAATRARELGGTVVLEPFDVMDVGRMAVVQEPSGAGFALWEARTTPGAALVNAPGALCWNELATRDPDAARTFCAELLGWTFEPAGDDYWMCLVDGRRNGGLRRMGDHEPPDVPAHVLAYFAVADADAAVARVAQLGGTVHVPPMDMGVGAFAVASDPQGATFGLYAGQLDP